MGFSQPTPWKGSIGQETDWITFCQFELVSGKLRVQDACAPSSEACWTFVIDGKPQEFRSASDPIVELPPGHYEVAVRYLRWGKDRRVSRLRVLLKGSSGQRGKEVGGACIDTAKCGVCDRDVFDAAWPDYEADPESDLEFWVPYEEKYAVFVLDEQQRAVMAVVRSGFGDGGYPVYELVSGSRRVGVEVVFIKENEPYPF